MITDHPQVQFELRSGQIVEVDEGMVDILTELMRLGVETQFSCQDNMSRGYFIASGKTMRPLLKKIRKHHKCARYSLNSHIEADKLLNGGRVWDLVVSNRSLVFEFGRIIFKRNMRAKYSIEYSWHNRLGFRISLRWSAKDADKFLQMLKETN